MADVAVIIPWQASEDPWRSEAADWCLRRWRAAHGDWDVVVGHRGLGPWVKARAVHAALDGTDARTLVVADADVWADGGLDDVVDAVHDGQAAWGYPHGQVWRLNRYATRHVLDGADPATFGPDSCEEAPYPGVAGGGIVVVDRATLEATPLDPRFVGWGGEDASWGWALTTMAGTPARAGRRLWHLWHQPQERRSRQTGSEATEILRRRYRAARLNPRRMGVLLTQAQALLVEGTT